MLQEVKKRVAKFQKKLKSKSYRKKLAGTATKGAALALGAGGAVLAAHGAKEALGRGRSIRRRVSGASQVAGGALLGAAGGALYKKSTKMKTFKKFQKTLNRGKNNG